MRILACAAVAVTCLSFIGSARAADDQVARGSYLVEFGGCGDCHTPGHFAGKNDPRILGGSDVGFGIPGVGVFVGPNLTPDKATGLGNWTDQQIANAITKGERPDGRILSPIMPWKGFSHLLPSDVMAIVAYLRTLKPVVHQVPGPFGPNQEPTVPVMTIVSPTLYATFKPPPK
jgi:mono/diheme cytochrome c family protein